MKLKNLLHVNIIKRSKKLRILVFGAGAGGVNFYKQQKGNYEVVGFLDNDKQKHGRHLFGRTIFSPEELSSLRFEKIFIASDYYIEIFDQLVSELGIDENSISIFHTAASASWIKEVGRFFLSAFYDRMCRKKDLVSDFIFWLTINRESGVKRINLTWLDHCDKYKVHVFRGPVQALVQPPRVVGCNTPAKNILIPEVALYQFDNAVVYSISKSVKVSDNNLIMERVTTSTATSADYCSGHVIHHGEKLALVRDAVSTESLPQGIIINGGGELNYYHWVAEILTQLQFVDELPHHFIGYPLLISEYSQKIPAIKSMLECLTAKHRIIFLKAVTGYKVCDLLMISAPVNLVPNYKGSVVGRAENSFARPESINFLRAKIMKLKSKSTIENPPPRVFLARKNYLRKYNQEEIIFLLEKYDFVPVYMDDLGIADQICIISNAQLIVGPSGAAWTNIIFASPGTKALCWMPLEFGQTACFSNIAHINEMEMDYILYPAGTSNSRELYYHEYKIELSQVKKWVSSQLETDYHPLD